MTNARIFLAGVGTTILLIAAGFSGGLMFARTAMEPMAATSSRAVADRLPPARVILPGSAEAAAPPQLPPATVAASVVEPAPILIEANADQSPARERAAERSERLKVDANERERRKRVAERKAKRDAARIAKQQQELRQAPSIMAFGRDDERAYAGGGFFGN